VRMNEARDALMQAFSAAGQQVYQAQAAGGQGGASVEEEPAGGRDAEEDIVEADYEIVDEEKN